MFWQFGFHDSSTIDALLEKDDVTLQHVLDESSVIQETKGQNTKLLEYLMTPDHFDGLIDLVIDNPSEDEPIESRYKYPSVACDILSSEVKQICAGFFDEPARIERLWDFFQRPLPLHPLQASFITRILIALMQKQPTDMATFIRDKGHEGLYRVLHHLGTNGVLELVKKMISSHVPSENSEMLQWLSECDFVGTVVSMLHGKDNRSNSLAHSFDYGTTDMEVISMTISNAKDLLLEMVNVREELSISQYEDSTPIQLLRDLTMPINMKLLTDITFRDPGMLPRSFSFNGLNANMSPTNRSSCKAISITTTALSTVPTGSSSAISPTPTDYTTSASTQTTIQTQCETKRNNDTPTQPSTSLDTTTHPANADADAPTSATAQSATPVQAEADAEMKSPTRGGATGISSASLMQSASVAQGIEAGMTVIEKIIHRYQIQRRGVEDPYSNLSGEPIILTIEQKSERHMELDLLCPVFDAIQECIPYLKDVLKTSPQMDHNYTTTSPPFGVLRLTALQLLYRLVSSRIPAIDEAIAREDILSICMDVFFQYPSNTFLHVLVTKIIHEVLRLRDPRSTIIENSRSSTTSPHTPTPASASSVKYRPIPRLDDPTNRTTAVGSSESTMDDSVLASKALYRSLFNQCGICMRLLKAATDCETDEARRVDDVDSGKPKSSRRPTYMCHVIQMANMVERSLRGEAAESTRGSESSAGSYVRGSVIPKSASMTESVGESDCVNKIERVYDDDLNEETGICVPDSWGTFVSNDLVRENALLALPLGGTKPSDILAAAIDSDDDMGSMEDEAAQLGIHRILAQQLTNDLPDEYDTNIDFEDNNNDLLCSLDESTAAGNVQHENMISAEREFTSDFFSVALQSAFDDPADEGLSSSSGRGSNDEQVDPWKDAFDMLQDEHETVDSDDSMSNGFIGAGDGAGGPVDEWGAFKTEVDSGSAFKATSPVDDDMWGAFEKGDKNDATFSRRAGVSSDSPASSNANDEWADFQSASNSK
eukprot:CFRG1101T1